MGMASIAFGGTRQKQKSQGIFGFQKKYLREKLLPMFSEEYQSALPGYDKTSSDLLNASLAGLENIASKPGGTDELGQASRSRLQSFITGDENFDKYFQDTIADPLMEYYTQKVLPQNKVDFLGDLSGSQRNVDFQTGQNKLITDLTREKTRVEVEGMLKALELAAQGAGSTDVSSRLEAVKGALDAQQQAELIRRRRSEQLLNAVLGGGGFSKGDTWSYGTGGM
jgi:hypothetical protein